MFYKKKKYPAPEPIDIERAWGTLCIAIMYKKYVTPEQAMGLWENGRIQNYQRDPYMDQEIISYRDSGMTWRSIGELLGMSGDFCYRRYHRTLERNAI